MKTESFYLLAIIRLFKLRITMVRLGLLSLVEISLYSGHPKSLYYKFVVDFLRIIDYTNHTLF